MLKQVQHDNDNAIDITIAFFYSNCMGFLRRAFEFLSHPSHSRTMGLVVTLILVAAVSLTVYVAQQQQQLRQRAAGQEVCSAIDTIQKCTSDFCNREGDICKIDNIIWECKRQ